MNFSVKEMYANCPFIYDCAFLLCECHMKERLGATSIHVVLQYSDINENLPFHSLFEVLFDLWQTITAMITDHVSVRLNGFFCNT